MEKEKFKIIDNAVSLDLQELIKKTVLDQALFPWFYYNDGTYGPDIPEEDIPAYKDTISHEDIMDTPQFTHTFFLHSKDNSPHHQKLIVPLLKELGLSAEHLTRAKANLLIQQNGFTENHFNTPHTDWNIDHTVLIYYVLDSDGDTILFNENIRDNFTPSTVSIYRRVKPKQGRVLLFDGSIFHSSCNPIKSKERVVFNINLAYDYRKHFSN